MELQRENELVRLAQAGDQDAFSQLFIAYRPTLQKSLLYMVGETAVDDVVQDAFVLAFTKIGQFEGGSRFYTWLYRIACNVFFMSKRRHKRYEFIDIDAPLNEEGKVIDLPEERDWAKTIISGLDVEKFLPLIPTRFQTYILYGLEGFGVGEIAEITGKPLSTVKSNLHRARKALRLLMGEPMSNKRRRKRLNKTKMVKSAAREVIGSPPPTKVRQSRKGGTGRSHDKPGGHYMHMSEPRPTRAPNDFVLSTNILARTPVFVRTRRGGRSGKGIQLTSEAVANANYLRESQGEDNMITTTPAISQNPVETALNDAREKHRFYLKKLQEVQQEVSKYETLVTQLESALDIVTGKVRVPSPNGNGNGNGNGHIPAQPHGFWKRFMKEKLVTPMTSAELRQLMIEAGTSDANAYQSIYKAKKDGLLVEQEGKLHYMEE